VSGGLAYSSSLIEDSRIRSIGNVGRLQRTRRVLEEVRQAKGLSPLDEALGGLRPQPLDARPRWQEIVADAKPSPVGVKFVQQDERLAIDPSGDETDVEATTNAITQQLYEGVKRRAEDFVPIAFRLNNQPGWQGIGDAAKRFAAATTSNLSEIPLNIGNVYDSVVELGSYLELDHRLRISQEASGTPLEPEVQRALSDLVRSAAPWIRRFPTARALDDEAGAFLARTELYGPAVLVADCAEDTELISSNDATTLRHLVETARRGELQGRKAGTRSAASIRNLALSAAGIATTFVLSAVSSDFATKSPLVARAGTFLAAAEASLMQLFSDSPADIQHALRAMLDELRKKSDEDNPIAPPRDTPIPGSPRRREDDDHL
jgi:hypothetical protein